MIYWTYVLDLVEINSLYIGITSNLMRRVREHKGGWRGTYLTGKYTFKSIVQCYPCNSHDDALLVEYYLKYNRMNEKEFIIPNCGGIDISNKLISISRGNIYKYRNYRRYAGMKP